MKHKVWLPDGSMTVEQLAVALGDLRYDSLADFLAALGQKIQQDGEQDASRNRHKLAEQLKLASQQLTQSAQHIQEVWEISCPYLFPADIRQKIRQDFITKADQKAAWQQIGAASRHWKNDQDPRLLRCVLHTVNGSLFQLEQVLTLAQQAPEKVMQQAECNTQGRQVRDYNLSFEGADFPGLESSSLPPE